MHAQLLQSCLTLCDSYGLHPARLLCSWDSPSKNTGVGCHALLQGIFLTQGSNPCLLCLPALASRFFITSATWEADNLGECSRNLHNINSQLKEPQQCTTYPISTSQQPIILSWEAQNTQFRFLKGLLTPH